MTATQDEFWTGENDPLEDPQERKMIYSVLDSFRQYRRAAHFNTTHVRRRNFYALPRAHQEYLSNLPFSLLDTLSEIDDAIDVNADLAEAIMRVGAASLGLEMSDDVEPVGVGAATKTNIDKCRSTINQLFRDWTAEGVAERRACYEPIIRDLQQLIPHARTKPKILVPGSGLGRLVYELCKAGYDVEGNEISYHQLFASNYILNHVKGANEVYLYPFVPAFSNNLTRQHQLKRVAVPDEWPGSLASNSKSGSMSVTTGDFCVLYNSKEYISTFDAVTTVFFIDTAPNLIRYVETVRNCLKPGAVWINLGPLLWHFDTRRQTSDAEHGTEATIEGDVTMNDFDEDRGVGEPGSFELSEDEVIKLVKDHGFEMIKHEVNTVSTGYMQDPDSMLQHIYRPAHWVARKL